MSNAGKVEAKDFKKNKISSPLGLTINNLVYNRHGDIHSIGFNDFSRFAHPDMGGDYGFYSIPLTEEWLVNFGFEKKEGEAFFRIQSNESVQQPTYFSMHKNSWNATGDGYYTYWQLIDGRNFVRPQILYVHQLQNLFFALTGAELEVK